MTNFGPGGKLKEKGLRGNGGKKMTTITVNAEKKQHEISPLLYGIFFEDINYAGDGGLYAELVANRSFSYYRHKHIGEAEDRAEYHRMCWEPVGEVEFTVATERPLNEVHTHYVRVSGAPDAVGAV